MCEKFYLWHGAFENGVNGGDMVQNDIWSKYSLLIREVQKAYILKYQYLQSIMCFNHTHTAIWYIFYYDSHTINCLQFLTYGTLNKNK